MISDKVNEIYNIGSGERYTNLEIINKIAKGKDYKIKMVKDRLGHDTRYALNSSKIKRNVKWSSKINIKEGLEKTFNWYFTNQEYFKLLKKKDIISRLGNK